MIKNKRGVTLVVLILTIIIILILSGTVIQYVNISNDTQNYNKMLSDIELLEDKIIIYYNDYGELPTKGTNIIVNSLPIGTYKEIDLTKLGTTLNYGTKDDNTIGSQDYYVIEINTHEVYYVEGITMNGTTYYSN